MGNCLAASKITVTTTANDQWTEWLRARGNHLVATNVGTGSATVTLQGRVSGATTVFEQTISAGRSQLTEYGNAEYRLGIKTGGVPSGSLELTLEVCE